MSKTNLVFSRNKKFGGQVSNCAYLIVMMRGSVKADDDLHYVEENSLIIGVARITTENDSLVVRGMQLLEPYRGKGIGSRL